METKVNIAILDMDSIMFAIGNPNKVLDETGDPMRIDNKFVYTAKTDEELIQSADYMMNSILTKCNCTHYIAFIKGKNTTAYRKAVKADYKALRPKESPKWWEFCKTYLMKNWGIVQVDNIEVDDAVNIARLKLKDSFIVAIDKDLLNLEGLHYNWKTDKWIGTTALQAEYHFWADMIQGQSGDGISGLLGRGPAYVSKLFTEKLSQLSYPFLVLSQYIIDYGERKGIEEFYKNYMCLKLLEIEPGDELELNIIKYDRNIEGLSNSSRENLEEIK